MKTKYTKEELSKLAQGVFKDDKTSPSIYANEEGTFLNSVQYEERKKTGEHKEFKFEFTNPNVKAAPAADESAKDAEIAKLQAELSGKDRRIAELSDEISAFESKVPQLESELENARAIISERDAELATLKAKLIGPPAPPQDAKKKSTKPAKA